MNIFQQHRTFRKYFIKLAHEQLWSDYTILCSQEHARCGGCSLYRVFDIGRAADGNILSCCGILAENGHPRILFMKAGRYIQFEEGLNLLLNPNTNLHGYNAHSSGTPQHIVVLLLEEMQQNVLRMRTQAQKDNNYLAFERVLTFDRQHRPTIHAFRRDFQCLPWKPYNTLSWLFLSLHDTLVS